MLWCTHLLTKSLHGDIIMNNFNNLTINDLFIVSELPSFSSIRNLASHMDISAAALSKRITLIEKCLNRSLISRSSKGINITEEGLTTAKWANEILIKTNTLPRKEASSEDKKNLVVGSRGFLISSLLPCFVKAFSTNYKLSFIDLSPKDTSKLMRSQQIDISITLDQKDVSENWKSYYIGDLVWELMCNKENTISKTIGLEDLEKHSIAHSTFYDGDKVVYGEDFLKVPQNYKNHGHGIQNTASAISLALSSDQLIFVPKLAAKNELKQNTLKIVNIRHIEKTINPIYLNVNIDKVTKKSLEILVQKLENFLLD